MPAHDEPSAPPGLGATKRETDTVTPLELFFDLVFVLTLTQATTLMASNTTWSGVGQAMLVLAIMWWSWVGYAWLTSVIDPEEGAVRLVFFAATTAFLLCAIAIPSAFGDTGLLFAGAFTAVRIAHIGLFTVASRGNQELRSSVLGLAAGTALAAALLIAAAFTGGPLQAALWIAALALDMGGPYFFGVEGWQLSPGHFAERHGLIVIIALGESVVELWVGTVGVQLHAATVAVAIVGMAVSFAMWWFYFDVTSLVAERRLAEAEPGAEQNAVARDSFSYLHFPMVAGIVLVALGFKKAAHHPAQHLVLVAAAALLGGVALYLAAQVAFRWRTVHRFSTQRALVAVLLLALIPLAAHVSALVALSGVAVILVALLVFETLHFSELRVRLRAELKTG